MAENVWKLLLEAEDRLIDTVKQDTEALGKLATAATKIPAIKVQSNVREVVTKDAAAIDGLKAKMSAGISGDALHIRGYSPAREAALAGLYSSRGGGPIDSGASPWGGLIGRIPGGGLTMGATAAFGGGMALAGAMAAGLVAIKGTTAILREVQETDIAAQRAADRLRKTMALSVGATETFSQLGTALLGIGLALKKVFGESQSVWFNLFRFAIGFTAGGPQALLGRYAPKSKGALGWAINAQNAVGDWGIEQMARAGADVFMGGTGESDVASAEVRLEQALERRKQRQAAAAAAAGAPEALMGVPIDEMARRGLFVGSSAGMSTTQLLTDSNRKLDRLIEGIKGLPAGMAEKI